MSQAKVLTDTEIKRAFAIATSMRYGRRNKLVIALSIYTGMRAGEIASISIGDIIDPDGNVRDRIHLGVDQTKGRKGRTVLLSQKAQSEISGYLSYAQINLERKSKPLIATQFRGYFSPNTIVTLFRRIYDLAGLSDARSHSGRRSFITKLANKGVSVRVVQTLAGHSSMQTTQRYIDVNEGMLVSAIELA